MVYLLAREAIDPIARNRMKVADLRFSLEPRRKKRTHNMIAGREFSHARANRDHFARPIRRGMRGTFGPHMPLTTA